MLDYDSSMKYALKAAFLSFSSTRVSANDVDYPIDVVYYEKDSFEIVEKRFDREELQSVSDIWQKELIDAVDNLPDQWLEKIFEGKKDSLKIEK